MKFRVLWLIWIFCAFPVLTHAGNNSHDPQQDSLIVHDTTYALSTLNDSASIAYQKAHNTGTLADFPRLHPLIVHFPIVFIILAFVIQIISFFVFKRELSWVSLFLIVFGFIGAYVSTNILHGGDPDPAALNAIARETFEKHELYAHYTEWISGIAAIVKIISVIFLKRKLWIEIISVILLEAAVYTITVTGDMGARLVHIDGIGVQGNKIPLHDMD